MSSGLLSDDGQVVTLTGIECTARIVGDFGTYTLLQRYRNDTDAPLRVRYFFPVPADSAVIGFTAKTKGALYRGELVDKEQAIDTMKKKSAVLLTKLKSAAFEAQIGHLAPGAQMEVEIRFISRVRVDEDSVRIFIPTVIAPRYIPFGRQMAIESIVSEAVYQISFSIFYHGRNISAVVSPTHAIKARIEGDGASISYAGDCANPRDIIIDVFLQGRNRPMMYYFGNTAHYSFVPKLDIYRKEKREYHFLLDISPTMRGEKLYQAIRAVLICIRALEEGDTFNITAFDTKRVVFSETALPASDEAVSGAKRFLAGLSPGEGSSLLQPVLAAAGGRDCVLVLLTDGCVDYPEDVLAFAEQSVRAAVYCFGFSGGVNERLLQDLSALTGGRTRMVSPSERIDEAVVKEFNRIRVSVVRNCLISFDVPNTGVAPRFIRRLHAGERVCVTASFHGRPPQSLTVTGDYAGVRYSMQVQFEHPFAAGGELLLFHAKERMDALLRTNPQQGSHGWLEARRLSLKYGILSDTTGFLICYDDRSGKRVTDVVILSAVGGRDKPFDSAMRETNRKKTRREEFYRLIQRQYANGSFARTDAAERTARAVYRICTECDCAELFVWHLRKAVAFLLGEIGRGDTAVIPGIVLDALSVWEEGFAGNDEISQKVKALTYLYRKNR